MREPEAGEVHVMRASLEAPPERVAALRALLSDDERARADRFHFDRHRRRFVVARATLRQLLAGYTGRRPQELVFAYGALGKPALAGGGDLYFNVSHSDELAIYAVTRGHEVGVDVERLRDLPGAERIAARFFSVPEREELSALPPAARVAGFFTCWTRKEAYVKARGDGLAHPLHAFAVSAAPGSPAWLRSTSAEAADVARFSLAALPVGEGFVGAVAVESSRCRISSARWPPS
jgi:4'-phosphopantetheinyl transferase